MNAIDRFASPKPHGEVPLDSAYASLGSPYHTQVNPTPLPDPRMIHFNSSLSAELGINDSPEELEALTPILVGNQPWPGYAPLASVYAGHQFGTWVSQLGDGRALMISEIRKPDGSRSELQLKGAGQTPYSRTADGRAVLRSSVREYLCSEAMHALGIPTTRCLSLVGSPEEVYREQIETAAVVCRVSPSFVRFGHFEFFYNNDKPQYLAPLADHVINEHFPHLADRPDRYAEWLKEVVARTANLMSQWQAVGFCHGVMNTDNFSILGLTLDYGPFGFMDAFRQHHICNHSDYEGRYAYAFQPEIGAWNCSRLLQATLPLLSSSQEEAAEIAVSIYDSFAPTFSTAALERWTKKLGLVEVRDGDAKLVGKLLTIMHQSKSDFTNTFRKLALIRTDTDGPATGIRENILDMAAFDAWVLDYRNRLLAEQNTDDDARAARMNQVNPKYVLRNHLAQAAIDKAEVGDVSEIHNLMNLLSRPFDEQPGMETYAAEPPDDQRHIEVSCSS